MKKNTILLPLLCCIVATAPLFATEGHSSSSVGAHGDRMPTQSFKEKLKAILVDNPDNGRRLIKELYESQDELHDDLATGGFFTQEELQVLFHFAKKLDLPIIVGKGREGIIHFKIYKGNRIERERRIDLSDNKKLMEFYISDDFEYLDYIDLNNCSLTDIVLPKKLPNLRYLNLKNNQLSQIKLPEELPKLDRLYLENNQLSQITLPEELPKLKGLSLNENQLSQVKLPEELPDLEILTLDNNQLTEIKFPNELPKLKGLSLNENQLSQIKLPEELPELRYLYLKNNQLSQIKLPEELPKLDRLYLENNQLSQITLPEELPKLKGLSLNENQLSQVKLPEELPDLEILTLDNNQLTEIKFPNELPKLDWMKLHHNQLTQLTLPKISPETRNNRLLWTFDEIQTVTAFYNDGQHTFENQDRITIMDYVRTGIVVNHQYKIGIDVHDGVRDNKTKELAQLFEQK